MYLSKFYDKNSVKKINLIYFIIPFVIMLPVLSWYAYVMPSWEGNGVVKGILGNDKTLLQLLDILRFNLISTLPELLVNYATVPVFVIGFYYLFKQLNFKSTIHRSFIYIGVCLIIYFLYEMHLIDKVKYVVVLSFLISPITAYLRCNSRWNTETPGFTKEFLSCKKQLQEIIPKEAKVIVFGDDSRSIVLYHLQRKGWSVGQYGIKDKDFEDGMKRGATFVITDCYIDTNQVFKRHVDSLLFKKNDVKLYLVK